MELNDITIYTEIEDDVIRYVIWAYYTRYDVRLVERIDNSYQSFYNLSSIPIADIDKINADMEKQCDRDGYLFRNKSNK